MFNSCFGVTSKNNYGSIFNNSSKRLVQIKEGIQKTAQDLYSQNIQPVFSAFSQFTNNMAQQITQFFNSDVKSVDKEIEIKGKLEEIPIRPEIEEKFKGISSDPDALRKNAWNLLRDRNEPTEQDNLKNIQALDFDKEIPKQAIPTQSADKIEIPQQEKDFHTKCLATMVGFAVGGPFGAAAAYFATDIYGKS